MAAADTLRIGPSYAKNSRTLDIFPISSPRLPPEYADNLDLLRKYFGTAAPRAPYSSMTDEEQATLIAIVKQRIASLKDTLNALLQTSSISLKNASYMDKINSLNSLIGEIASRAAPVATVTVPSSQAPDSIHATLQASYMLLRRNDISFNDLSANWAAFTSPYATMTLQTVLDATAETIPSPRIPPADSIKYLSHAYMIDMLQTMLGTPTNNLTYRRQFVPIFQGLLTDLLQMPANKDTETKLPTGPTGLLVNTSIPLMNTLLTSPTTPPPTLPVFLTPLSPEDRLYVVSMLLIKQFIEENK